MQKLADMLRVHVAVLQLGESDHKDECRHFIIALQRMSYDMIEHSCRHMTHSFLKQTSSSALYVLDLCGVCRTLARQCCMPCVQHVHTYFQIVL
ncbi:MAG: hypothetical protein ACKPKO_61020, partial [Candidatus Fonsibacter sp.]